MGLAGATELAARKLAPAIRVNAIAPSVTLVSGPQTRANFEAAHVLNPLGRGVQVEDLVRALLYLVDTPTVTGQTLTIDSGQRFLALPRDVAYMIEP
jgi:NAD(P)-dependent dehydrogenase (short-subunit alcohol dehydrogenase family)